MQPAVGTASNGTWSVAQEDRTQEWLADSWGYWERDPQGVQRFLNSAKWNAGEVRDDLRSYVVEHLGDKEMSILIADETGFLKKGEKSVGVARQYTGTAGDTVNCQVGVFLAYTLEKGAAFIDRALYLPKSWTNAPARRTEAGVPEGLIFRNDHRSLLGGIFWVARTGSSWREVPQEYGKWRLPTDATIYGWVRACGNASSERWEKNRYRAGGEEA